MTTVVATDARPVPADRGGGPIEFAIVLPLLLTLVFTIAHLGLFFLGRQAALSTARIAVDGERAYAAPAGSGLERAERFLANAPAWLNDVEIVVDNDGELVIATVTGTTPTIIPGLTLTVRQTAVGPVERITEIPS